MFFVIITGISFFCIAKLYILPITVVKPNTVPNSNPFPNNLGEIDRKASSSSTLVDMKSTYETPPTSWKKYINKKFSFEVAYPPDRIAVAPLTDDLNKSIDIVSAINFRKGDNYTPSSETGYSIFIFENPSNENLLSLCSKLIPGEDIHGVLCTSKIALHTFFSNGIKWEKVLNESSGFVPTGWVRYATSFNNYLLVLVDYGNQQAIIDSIISSFKFFPNSGLFNK